MGSCSAPLSDEERGWEIGGLSVSYSPSSLLREEGAGGDGSLSNLFQTGGEMGSKNGRKRGKNGANPSKSGLEMSLSGATEIGENV